MISYWLLLFFILIFSGLLAVIISLILRKTSFAVRRNIISITFLIPVASLCIYVTFGCLNVCVIKNEESVKRYVSIYNTTYKFENGNLIAINFENKESSCVIINDTATPIYFDLIGYSKNGNTSIEYGHKDILPYSINTVTQYPDFFFSTPPNEVTVSGSKYAASSLEIRGWLHKD